MPRINLDALLCAAVDKPESMGENEAIPAILSGPKIIVNRCFGQIFAISLKQLRICSNVLRDGRTSNTSEKTCI